MVKLLGISVWRENTYVMNRKGEMVEP